VEGDGDPGGIATWTEIGIAEDIHEINVGDIAGKVATTVLSSVALSRGPGSFPIAE